MSLIIIYVLIEKINYDFIGNKLEWRSETEGESSQGCVPEQ